MFDIESIILWLRDLPPVGIYVALFFTTYIENVFPPSPSDVILLFIATLIGIGTINFVPTIIIATLGSVTGFLTAFFLGRRFGRKLTNSNRFPFLTKRSLVKVDSWFDTYGYGVIVINRFMAGTRAVVSFFAGMSELDIGKTTFFCLLSALAWNILVVQIGKMVGQNWERGQEILSNYGRAVMIIMGALVLIALGIWLYRTFWKKESEAEQDAPPESESSPAPMVEAEDDIHNVN